MNLTKPQLEAIELLFQRRVFGEAIAKNLGVDARTIRRWQNQIELAAALDAIMIQRAATGRSYPMPASDR
jgi:hypothetical protein